MTLQFYRSIRAFAPLLVLSLCALAPAWGADAEAGKAVFLKKCKTCHGAEGQGNAGMAKVLKVEIKHLGDASVQEMSDDDIKKTVLEGVGKMKPVKAVEGADLDNVLAFVRTLKK